MAATCAAGGQLRASRAARGGAQFGRSQTRGETKKNAAAAESSDDDVSSSSGWLRAAGGSGRLGQLQHRRQGKERRGGSARTEHAGAAAAAESCAGWFVGCVGRTATLRPGASRQTGGLPGPARACRLAGYLAGSQRLGVGHLRERGRRRQKRGVDHSAAAQPALQFAHSSMARSIRLDTGTPQAHAINVRGGSRLPLCHGPIIGRLWVVFNEDFLVITLMLRWLTFLLRCR